MKSGRKNLAAFAFLVASYVISGKAAIMLAVPPGYASAIFPPAGIAITAAFILGRKALPWVFLGSIILNLWIGHAHAGSMGAVELEAALLIAIASTAQAALGGWILRRKIGYPAAFDQARQISRFLLLSPVICLTSASLSIGGLEWIGMFDGHDVATNWFSWWAGDTLGLLVMLPIVMSVAGEPGSLWKKRIATVALPMLIALSLMVFTFVKANQWEQSRMLSDFREVSQQSADQIRMGLEEQGALLGLLHGFFEHDQSGSISRLEFQRFCQETTRKFPMIRAMEWVPRVSDPEREAFEKKQRKDFPGYEIRKRNQAGLLEREGNRAWYYPVTYIVPMTGNERALGVDLLSMPRREEAVDRAIRSEEIVATEPVQLVQGGEGLLIIQSVKLKGEARGLVLIVLKMQDFMDRILPASSRDLDILLLDARSRSALYQGSGNRHFDALY
ncbi:MAG: diguanylate cyclase, partial [Burkholderiales bacterium]|nr:diguanylate cyclase [Burkholderiales bacterium]